MTLKTLNISKDWTLFLDRDGVINQRFVDNYVATVEDFHFIDGVTEAIKHFTTSFGRLLVVTNQQGIDKGLMTDDDLAKVHNYMLAEIEKANGRVSKVYYCAGLAKHRPFRRKPQVGMGLHAKADYPEINFKKSVMAGDSKTDMEFGKRLKMKTVLIGPDNKIAREHPGLVDFWFPSLIEMAKQIEK